MSEIGLEVLAPAGDPDIFCRVIDAGADAVYFGGHAFGARAYATNFTLQNAEASIRYAHARGRKAYLTVNTLLKNREIEQELYPYLKSYYEIGLDAVIVQDYGVFTMVRDYFPKLAIHCSTQMSIATPDGAAFLQAQGAHRIVTAREISLQEISEIYDHTGVEIETFVHGALCVSYSGQCLMSSMIGGRSGNRGRCAQPCRLTYDAVGSNGKPLSLPGNYTISPKDLCGIRDIPALFEAGVYSLKIEGRMKQGDYAEGVVAMYRKYVDRYLSDGASAYMVSDADYETLLGLGNRNGFSNAYYYHRNDTELITFTDSAHRNQKAKPTGERKQKVQLPICGEFTANLGEPMTLCVCLGDGSHRCEVSGAEVQAAQKQSATIDDVRQKLSKTGNTPYTFGSLDIHLQEGVFLPGTQLNELRRTALEQLEEQMVACKERECLPLDIQQSEEANLILKGCMVTLRKKALVDLVCSKDYVTYVGLDTAITFDTTVNVFDVLEQLHQAKKQVIAMMPVIFRKNCYGNMDALLDMNFDYYMATSMDALGYLLSRVPKEKILLDERLYTYSNYAQMAYDRLGISANTVPYELNEKELRHRDMKHSFFTVYGYTPLMYMANCTHKNACGCDHVSTITYLKDRYGNPFPVVNACEICTNVLYNYLPTNLLTEPSVDSFHALGKRLDFTIESVEQAEEIFKQFETASLTSSGKMFTKGHFHRGVE